MLIANDGVIESTEQFRVRLQVAAGLGGVSLSNDTATVTILDNDSNEFAESGVKWVFKEICRFFNCTGLYSMC